MISKEFVEYKFLCMDNFKYNYEYTKPRKKLNYLKYYRKVVKNIPLTELLEKLLNVVKSALSFGKLELNLIN